MELKVGDTVFLQPVGNNVRDAKTQYTLGSVVKVARKYIYVATARHGNNQFRFLRPCIEEQGYDGLVDADYADSNGGYRIFTSEANFDAFVTHKNMRKEIQNFFSSLAKDTLPSEDVEHIYDVLLKRGVVPDIKPKYVIAHYSKDGGIGSYDDEINGNGVVIYDNRNAAEKRLEKIGAGAEAKIIKSCGHCRRCGSPLFPSCVEGYAVQCFNCDEDFFEIEQPMIRHDL